MEMKQVKIAEKKKEKKGRKMWKQKGRKSMHFPLRNILANFPLAVAFAVLPPKVFINKLGNVSIGQLTWRFRLKSGHVLA
jgi:hypothetical protein